MKRFLLLFLIPTLVAAQGAEAVFDYKSSKVEIEVKATGHDFAGTLSKYHATAQLDKDLVPTAGKLTWDFKDLKTGNGSRDKKMLSWLSPKLTKASFTFEKWLKDKEGKTSAQGTMEIHGVKQKLSFPVSITQTGAEIIAKGDAVVDHTNFKLPVITFLKFFKVNPKVRLKFVVKGSLK